jgi:hypothetical protein
VRCPYCPGSLLPSRFRLGPLRTRILAMGIDLVQGMKY